MNDFEDELDRLAAAFVIIRDPRPRRRNRARQRARGCLQRAPRRVSGRYGKSRIATDSTV